MRSTVYTIFITVAFFSFSCTNQEAFNVNSQLSNKQAKSIRSFEEALQIAQSSISLLDGSAHTRSGSSRKIDLNNWKICTTDSKTRTDADINDTLMYIFNFEDNQGFAIVSASLETDGLLAVTESGNYDPRSSSTIEGFNQFIERAKEYVAHSMTKEETESKGEPILYYRDSLVYSSIVRGPYLSVNWGQFYPEGEFCPNGIAGCTNTAVAQIMSYYSYPTSISLTYSNADISTQTLNWSQLRLHQTGHNLANCQAPDTTSHKAIGRLLRQLGQLAYSAYYNGYTSTQNNYLQQVMNTLGYQYAWVNIAPNLVKSQLDYQKLLLVNGTEGTNIGHAWVLDGYRYITTTRYRYVREGEDINDWILHSVTETHTNLYHFNWGWYGECNGLFNSAVYYNPMNSHDNMYDELSGNHDHTFTLGNSMAIWLN